MPNESPPSTPTMTRKAVVRVYFNDCSFKTFAVADNFTTGDLCAMFAKKMNLKGTTVRHFCLNVVQNGEQMERLGNQSIPYELHKEYMGKNIGWGASNQNCFLFCLKSETAKRMTICLTAPQDRATERTPLRADMGTLRLANTPARSPSGSPMLAGTRKPLPTPPSTPPAVAPPGFYSADYTAEFTGTKLKNILNTAQKNEQGEEKTPAKGENEAENLSKFMDEMDDLVNVLMQLSGDETSS